MTQRYVPVIPRALAAPMLALSLFLIVGPMGGVASAEAPNAPAAPAVGQARPRVLVGALTVTTPVTGDTVTTRRPAFTGTGTAGDTVTVWPEEGRAYCSVTIGTTGTWTCTPNRDLPIGNQVIVVNETAPVTLASTGLVRLRLFVAPDGTTTDKPCPPDQDDNQKKDDHHEWDHHHSIFDW